ncbi:hypothetical protein Tco_1284549 [Tanacetum coccineum]
MVTWPGSPPSGSGLLTLYLRIVSSVALFHLELEMNHVRMKHFDDFECMAGLSSVRGFHQLCLKLTLKHLSLRNLGSRCLLTDLPDEWMRMEVVEEELRQNWRLRLCQKPLMRLTVVEEEVVVKEETQAEYLENLAYFSS